MMMDEMERERTEWSTSRVIDVCVAHVMTSIKYLYLIVHCKVNYVSACVLWEQEHKVYPPSHQTPARQRWGWSHSAR